MASPKLPTHLNGIKLSARSSWLLGAPIAMLINPNKITQPIYHPRSPWLKSYLESAPTKGGGLSSWVSPRSQQGSPSKANG